MSSDAKVWQEEDGYWSGLHDGACDKTHEADAYSLRDLLIEIEECARPHSGRIRWEFRLYPDGKAGLIGYTY